MTHVTMFGPWFAGLRIEPKLVSDMLEQPDLEALTEAIMRLGAVYGTTDPAFQEIVTTSIAMGEALAASPGDFEVDDSYLEILRAFQGIA